MAEIAISVRHVANIVQEISAASDEQSTGIAAINCAIAHMDAVTNQRTALLEQAFALLGEPPTLSLIAGTVLIVTGLLRALSGRQQ